jgi:hypothetical protein
MRIEKPVAFFNPQSAIRNPQFPRSAGDNGAAKALSCHLSFITCRPLLLL